MNGGNQWHGVLYDSGAGKVHLRMNSTAVLSHEGGGIDCQTMERAVCSVISQLSLR